MAALPDENSLVNHLTTFEGDDNYWWREKTEDGMEYTRMEKNQ